MRARMKVGSLVASAMLALSVMAPTTALADVPKSITYHNDMYSINGVQYTFYKTEAGAKAGTVSDIAKDTSGNNAVLTVTYTDGDKVGKTPTLELVAGDYWVVETKSGKNTNDDTTFTKSSPKKVTVATGTTAAEPTVVTSVNTPKVITPPPIVKTGDTDGTASLKDCIVKVEYFGTADTSKLNASTLKKTWYFATDADGKINMETAPSTTFNGASSDSFYQVNGKRVFLAGTYRWTEVQPPEGRMSSDAKPEVRVEEPAATAETLKDTKNVTFTNDVLRAGVILEKVDLDALHGLTKDEADAIVTGQGDGNLVGAQFAIFNCSGKDIQVDGKTYKSVSESGEVVDGKIGGVAPVAIITTELVDGKVVAKTATDALPYAKYFVVEIKPPVGYEVNDTKLPVPEITEDNHDTLLRVGSQGDDWVSGHMVQSNPKLDIIAR